MEVDIFNLPVVSLSTVEQSGPVKRGQAVAEKAVLENKWWCLEVEIGRKVNASSLISKPTGWVAADRDYVYQLGINGHTYGCQMEYQSHQAGEDRLLVSGKLTGEGVPDGLGLAHHFRLPSEEPALYEQVELVYEGKAPLKLEALRFGFQKLLYGARRGRWCEELDRFTLTPLVTRRFKGLLVDRGRDRFTPGDLLSCNDAGGLDFCEEAWVWGDGEKGLLVSKYNQKKIELCGFQARMCGPRDAALIFGGAVLYRGDPEEAATWAGSGRFLFGETRYEIFEGDWQTGYLRYRDHLDSRGHHFPADYAPRMHWNELYNFRRRKWGSTMGLGAYSLEQLQAEAELASQAGAKSLYLDPRWDTDYGSTIWDNQRLGRLADFVKMIKEQYGLEVALHTITHAGPDAGYEGMCRIDENGQKVKANKIWAGWEVCCSEPWLREKTERLGRLVDAGVRWLMIDFNHWKGACHANSHGHQVPSRRQDHVLTQLQLLRNLRSRYPDLEIELHDPIRGGFQDYCPVYFLHALPGSYQENWGYEFMWNPLRDLLDGRALSLYEYNLACNIPLYLHIDCYFENKNMLEFWWYASTCRHLGIGGVTDPESHKFQQLRQAVSLYQRLRPFFTRGAFYGTDPLTHIHKHPESEEAVLVAFNTSNHPVKREVTLPVARHSLIADAAHAWDGVGRRCPVELRPDGETALLSLELPPMSPRIVWLGPKGTEM